MKKCFSSTTLFPSEPNRPAETVAIRRQALRDDTSGGWGPSDSGK